MAITSEQQLARLLAEMDSLTNDDRIEIMRGAYFVKGTLRGLYIAPMQRCPPAEVIGFFTSAGAFLFGVGGLQGGGRVYPDHFRQVTITHPVCHEMAFPVGYQTQTRGSREVIRRFGHDPIRRPA
jgi:hypothetical protein